MPNVHQGKPAAPVMRPMQLEFPGDPAVAILGSHATPQAIAVLHHRMHLDLPLPSQFALYLRGLAGFDLGESFRYGTPVTATILTKLPYTATIAFGSSRVRLPLRLST